MSEPIDLQGCEHCGKEFPIEQCTMMVDCWYCESCCAEWRAIFDSCEHDWRDDYQDGEKGVLCRKCNGFMPDFEMTTPGGKASAAIKFEDGKR